MDYFYTYREIYSISLNAMQSTLIACTFNISAGIKFVQGHFKEKSNYLSLSNEKMP